MEQELRHAPCPRVHRAVSDSARDIEHSAIKLEGLEVEDIELEGFEVSGFGMHSSPLPPFSSQLAVRDLRRACLRSAEQEDEEFLYVCT